MDDDEDTRDLLAWSLLADGWLVESVADGQEALIAVGDFEPDVIVVDLRLPIIDGLAVTRQLKADLHTRHIPIVGISAMTPAGRAESLAVKAGCAKFVAKPCRPEELRALLEVIVEGRAGR